MKLYSGNTLEYWGKGNGVVTYSVGTMTWNDERWATGTGRWWLTFNRYCSKLPEQKARCRRIEDLGDGTYADGKYRMRIK